MCSLDKVRATFNSLQVLKNILLREWCQLKWQNRDRPKNNFLLKNNETIYQKKKKKKVRSKFLEL